LVKLFHNTKINKQLHYILEAVASRKHLNSW